MDLVEWLKGCSTKSILVELGEITHHSYSLVENDRFVFPLPCAVSLPTTPILLVPFSRERVGAMTNPAAQEWRCGQMISCPPSRRLSSTMRYAAA
jgi:hypothetical protein